MPCLIFVKTPVEVKPSFVDFDSPFYVDIFAKIVGWIVNAGEINPLLDIKTDLPSSISEMLPVPDQTWRNEAEARKDASEFRCVVAVDLAR